MERHLPPVPACKHIHTLGALCTRVSVSGMHGSLSGFAGSERARRGPQVMVEASGEC
jgi:hypothetical protein